MKTEKTNHQIDILLVEDNPGDVRLTMEALKEAKLLNTIEHVPDGVEALAYLRKEGKYSEASRSDLVLQDLNLPKKLAFKPCRIA